MPACVARLTNWLGLQTKLGLDDGADKKATILQISAEDAPHVNDVAGRPIKQAEIGWKHQRERNCAHVE